MLDNEPTTEAAETAATDAAPSTRRGAKKAPAAKKTTATRKRTVKKTAEPVPAAEAVPTQADDQSADPAPVKKTAKTAAKAAAKKAPAAKKTAAKAPAKKTTKRVAKKAAQDTLPDAPGADASSSTADAGPVVENAPAKKATRKRTTKKAAASADAASAGSSPAGAATGGLVTTDSPVTDGPVASADTSGTQEVAAPRKRTTRRRTTTTDTTTATAPAGADGASAGTRASRASGSNSAADADGGAGASSSDGAPAGETGARRTRRRAAAPAAVLFQAPTQDNPAQQAPVEATPLEAAAGTTPEPGADEQPTTRRRTRRGASADAEDTGAKPSTRRNRRGAGADGAQSAAGENAAADGSHSASTGTSDSRSASADPHSGAYDSHSASTDSRSDSADSRSAAADSHSGASGSRSGSAGAGAGDSRSGDAADDGSARTRTRRGASADGSQAADGSQGGAVDGSAATSGDAADESGSTRTRTRRSRRGAADTTVVEADGQVEAEADAQTDGHPDGHADDGDEGGEGTRRRRRRRGGRRRRKAGDADGADDSTDEHSDDDQDDHDTDHSGRDNRDGAGRGGKPDSGRDGAKQDAAGRDGSDDAVEDGDHDANDSDDDEGGSSSRRRRRRRRRKGEDSGSAPDDPDETVVRVREPRSKNTANEITAVEGSTRLEAKKQRRREGRAAGRRRAPIVTEAEFLARRESVERTMVIRSRDDLTQIAVSEDNVLVEHYVTTAEQTSLIGNVYLGRVQNVLPSMEAAFIDIGKGRNAVLYAGEVDWATLGGANGPRKIEQVLKSGQSVLVQVTKDPIGHKGARLTNQISLPGRYVVYVPRGGNGGISRKLPDTERNRLKTILKDIVPDEAGVIVRTAAEGASEEELTADVSRLQAAWEDIEKKSKNGQAPQLLYGEPDLLIRVVRDLFTEDFAKLVISGDQAYDQVRECVAGVAPHLVDRVEKAHSDVFANYRIDEQIKKALDRKVWLPSGGSLIIDRTEAMTVVDVNTGKFTGSGGNLEETVTKNNLEAAEEIVRQLRLRDIGGIIVIDFIDMVLESNRDLVLRRLVECLGRDRTKHQVAEVTSLGLVQMTRKRIGTGLLEAFSENCDHCGGRGLILHDEPKESRRRDSRGSANSSGNGGSGNGGSGNGGNGHDHGKAAQPEESGRKSSRRRRGKNRGEDEPAAEAEAPQHNGDAAQRLAQIAAATVKKDEEPGTPVAADAGTPEPTGYPIADAEAHISPEATGFPAAEVAGADRAPAEGAAEADATEAAQNGSGKSTRRRRSSRSRSKTATEGDGTGGSTDATELVSTHG
ncbi:hypothetical protein GCM10009804_61480 [Kribbella hippodromi]|uniref:S1 motif domain-containing protein n=1 Tax=Kribbella hippodromi TaxID=434347 RepID=A0ABP4PZP5_9ACTN